MSSDPDYTPLTKTWIYPEYNVRRDLFYPNGTPRLAFVVDMWKPAIDLYTIKYKISPAMALEFWMDIVELVMTFKPSYQTYPYPPSDEFKAWAYGCMCRFVLEKRDRRRYLKYEPEKFHHKYDPANAQIYYY